MATDAQKKANAAYRKKSVKQLVVRFYPNDEDEQLYEWIRSHENVNQYLKALARQDMKSND